MNELLLSDIVLLAQRIMNLGVTLAWAVIYCDCVVPPGFGAILALAHADDKYITTFSA